MSATLQGQKSPEIASKTLPFFDPKSHCPKCDFESLDTEFHQGGGHSRDLVFGRDYHIGCNVLFCDFDGSVPHLVRTCLRCKARFYQAPLDITESDGIKIGQKEVA